MDNRRTTNPVHHHSSSLSGTSLQIPPANFSQSPHSSPSFDQSKSRASTRQTVSSSTLSSDWSSVPGISANSPVKPYFFPTSGYPASKSILEHRYPGSGYPVSQLQHSYGYPSSNFPCCEVPGVANMRSQLQYPSSEFPGGGLFPGEFDQDDGSAPFIGSLDPGAYPTSDMGIGYPEAGPLTFTPSVTGGYAGSSPSFPPPTDTVYMPGSFDPQYNAPYSM